MILLIKEKIAIKASKPRNRVATSRFFPLVFPRASLDLKRSQVQGSTFRVRDKDKIEDPKSS